MGAADCIAFVCMVVSPIFFSCGDARRAPYGNKDGGRHSVLQN
jgi:hypothetical protein